MPLRATLQIPCWQCSVRLAAVQPAALSVAVCEPTQASHAAFDDQTATDEFPDFAEMPPEPSADEESLASQAFQEDVAGPAERTYTAADFVKSEWKVGVLWRNKKEIEETWIRCKEDGESEWGWGASGKWRIEEGSFVTFTRDYALGWNGRRLFSAKIGDDPNFVEGVVRGWKPFESASVMGQWQAIRLNVKDRALAPWMDESRYPPVKDADVPTAQDKGGTGVGTPLFGKAED